jgi:hypothetical protein
MPAKRVSQEMTASAPVHSVYPVTNWQQNAISPFIQGFNRVPYDIPQVTLESVRQGRMEEKKLRPLHEAVKALKLHTLQNGKTIVGPLQAPTPFARPRKAGDNAPSPVQKGEKGVGESIAEEERKLRVKYLQEKFGGDYQRWQVKGARGGGQTGAVQGHAAEALTQNDDLGPLTKVWTLDTVKKITAGTR